MVTLDTCGNLIQLYQTHEKDGSSEARCDCVSETRRSGQVPTA
jgi:hypothetical protein